MAFPRIVRSLVGIVVLQLCVRSMAYADETDVIQEGEVQLADSLDKKPDHMIKKRFSADFSGYEYPLTADDIMGDLAYGEDIYGEDMPIYADKRQASRWKYIYQKLNDLNRGSSKRSPLRWKLIYNKLNQLDNRPNSVSKRFAGRWKNQNWLLNRGDKLRTRPTHSLQKRFIGRWRNNNWILQQRNDRNH